MDSNEKRQQYWELDKKKIEEWERKGKERLKRENAITKNALLLHGDVSEPTTLEEESTKEEDKGSENWDCSDIVEKTVDYRLAGMNSLERLVFKYFGPGGGEPETEKPGPPYPLTLASRRNYNRNSKMRERDHNLSIQNVLKTRRQELSRLKTKLAEDAGRFGCHLPERRADIAERKRKFVEELARTYGFPEDALSRRADEIYENYRKRFIEEKKQERLKVQQQLEMYDRLLSEYKKKHPKPPPKRRPPKPKAPTLPELSEPEEAQVGEVEPLKVVEMKIEVTTVEKRVKTSKDESKQKEAKSPKGKSSKETKGTATKEKKGKTAGSKKSQKFKEPPRELQMPEKKSLENLFVPEILEGIGNWEKLEQEKMDLYLSTLEPPDPPAETGLVSSPPAIVIKDYLPKGVYKCKLSLTNVTAQAVHCRFHKVTYYTQELLFPFEVEPVDAQRLPAGLSFELNVCFYPETDGQVTEGRLEFHTRRTDQQTRLFAIPFKTTPRSAAPKLLPDFIQFPTVDVWNREIPKKILKLTNTGVVPCFATIRKKEDASSSIPDQNGMKNCIIKRKFDK